MLLNSVIVCVAAFFSASSALVAAASKNEEFEYIVIGSGPGGGPLAVNLAEAGHTVLLLEAGQNHTAAIDETMPIAFGDAQNDKEQGWWFYVDHYSDKVQSARDTKMVWEKPGGGEWVGTNPPPGSTQLGIWYPRAGTLGGCDTHNGGITVIPSELDWENIANITGDDSWKHDKMIIYWEKLERNTYLPKGTPGHGFAGYQPIGVGDKKLFENEPQILAVAQGSAAALGYDERSHSEDFDVVADRDINHALSDRDIKANLYQMPFKRDEHGRRFSAGSRVNSAIARGLPLTVRLGSLATKLVVDDTHRVTGVEYLQGQSLYKADPRIQPTGGNTNGTAQYATATREVIVSGGAFNTPQLLLLSGIGPAQELKQLGIPVVVDLPGVGKNLQDNYEVPVIQKFANNFTLFSGCVQDGKDQCYADWDQNGTGPYSTIGMTQIVAHKSSAAPQNNNDIVSYGAAGAIVGFIPPYSNATEFSTGSNFFTHTVTKSFPGSQAGSVTLKSTNPCDVPKINFEYFANGGDQDLQGMVEGIELARKMFDAAPGQTSSVEARPGREVDSADKLRQYIKDEAFGHHATSTAAIGSDSDPLAVLDSRFRVRGVRNLRVVDASVFPSVPGSFPVIAVFMISEKASEVILQDAQAKRGRN